MANSKESRVRYRNKRLSTQRGHVEHLMCNAKQRAKRKGIEFDLSLDYLVSIATQCCPILGIELSWGKRNGVQQDHSPSLDKIDPEKGYIEGNVMWLSQRANTLKGNGTAEEHRMIAEFLNTSQPFDKCLLSRATSP